nr:uncharacterized protein LOC123771559 [Procambarus clarkii]
MKDEDAVRMLRSTFLLLDILSTDNHTEIVKIKIKKGENKVTSDPLGDILRLIHYIVLEIVSKEILNIIREKLRGLVGMPFILFQEAMGPILTKRRIHLEVVEGIVNSKLTSKYRQEPRTAKAAPRTAKAAPRSAKAAPRSAKAAPRSAKAAPRSAKAAPRSAKAAPRSAKAAPRSAKAAPRSAKAAPRSAKAAPRSAKAAPRSAKAAPRSAKAAPRSAKEAPRSAKAAPRSAKAAPRSAKAAPRSAKAASPMTSLKTCRRNLLQKPVSVSDNLKPSCKFFQHRREPAPLALMN